MDKKYLLFDLDGTLTDPFEGITKSFQYALKSFGIDEKQEDLLFVIGPPLIETFCSKYGFDREKGQKAVDKYRERFAQIGWRENRLLDGVPKMLEKLKEDGKIIALATAKPYVFAVKILEYFNIAKYFDVVCGATLDGSIGTKTQVIKEVLNKLDNPPLNEVIMIGDRENDVLGARECGIECIGLRVGYAEENELENAGADYIIDTIEELEKFLLKIG